MTDLSRIANALERIAAVLEPKKPIPTKSYLFGLPLNEYPEEALVEFAHGNHKPAADFYAERSANREMPS